MGDALFASAAAPPSNPATWAYVAKTYSRPARIALPRMARGIARNGSWDSSPRDAALSKPTNPRMASTTANTTPSMVALESVS